MGSRADVDVLEKRTISWPGFNHGNRYTDVSDRPCASDMRDVPTFQRILLVSSQG